MNINSVPGTKVVFSHPSSGHANEQDTAKMYLCLGKTYTIKKIEVYSWYTDVFLEEVPEVRFSPILFK